MSQTASDLTTARELIEQTGTIFHELGARMNLRASKRPAARHRGQPIPFRKLGGKLYKYM